MYEQMRGSRERNLKIVKGSLKSGAVLTLGILNAIALFISIVSLLGGSYYQMIYESMRQIDSSMGSAAESIYVLMVIMAIFGSIPTILTIVGYIVIFAKSRNSAPTASPIAGVCILYVLSLIEMIAAIITVALMALFVLIGMIAAVSMSSNSNSYSIAMVFVGIITVSLCGFFMLFVTISKKNFFGGIKQSLTTKRLSNRGAGAYGVICIITAVLVGISTIFMLLAAIGTQQLTREYGYYSYSVSELSGSTIIVMVLAFLSEIFSAVMALGYKNQINRHLDDEVDDGYSPYAETTAFGGYQQPYSGYDHNVTPYGGYQNTPQDNYRTYGDHFQDHARYDYSRPYSDYKGNNSPTIEPEDDEKTIAADQSICPFCGAKTSGSSPFCGRCGKRLR